MLKKTILIVALLMLFCGRAEADPSDNAQALCGSNTDCYTKQIDAVWSIDEKYGNYLMELDTLPQPLWTPLHWTIAKCFISTRKNLPQGLVPDYVKMEECIEKGDQ